MFNRKEYGKKYWEKNKEKILSNRIPSNNYLKYVWENREEIFIKNSKRQRRKLKKLLLDNKILENKCSICNMLPVWQNKSLVLRLDHKDGDTNNNLIENLRLVCPNCDSQSEFYAGRNKGKK